MTVYPLSAVRTMALHAQGLTRPTAADTTPDIRDIKRMVEQLNYVQIDTLNLIQRAQYIVLWSRLGSYTPTDLDRLVYVPEERVLFEGVQGVAAILPLKDYRYQLPEFDKRREGLVRWYTKWLDQQGSHELVSVVYERIKQEGALKASDFVYDGPRRGSWWDWKPAKVALEYLFTRGDLMIANRVNFQRVYDLTERVLPGWVDTRMPRLQERDRYWIEQGLLALGICLPNQIAEYAYHMRRALPKGVRQELLDEGVIVPLQAVLADGQQYEMVVHHGQLQIMQQVADGAIRAERTTFLSFFDNLFWCRGRDLQVWGYRNIIESYVKAENRKYGYFCQSILHKDRIVGRFDPKLERKTSVLRLKALYLEPGVAPDEELVAGVATAMRDFLSFHKAKELVIERSEPCEFGEKLLKSI
ncbi:MAG: winged helix-turn-helix domain-containing protein [Anaerolineae bacterium]|nr:winged helix-turn-helix domain-containing protein [Anaerolineae bacterium]